MPGTDVSTLTVRMRDWQLGEVWFNLVVDHEFAQTVFPDGSVCPARRLEGQPADSWWWHDLLHNWLAWRMGGQQSRVLHDVANGRPDQPWHAREEAMVLAFEEYIRDRGRGDLDGLLPLCEWGRLHEFRRDACLMLGVD